MQNIWLLKSNVNLNKELSDDDIIFSTYHLRNGKYLEKEEESNHYKILCAIDDTSPSVFFDEFVDLLTDLIKSLAEAHQNNDTEIVLHILEIIVLCKFCIWHKGQYCLKFSPWGNASCSQGIPEIVRNSIAGLSSLIEKP